MAQPGFVIRQADNTASRETSSDSSVSVNEEETGLLGGCKILQDGLWRKHLCVTCLGTKSARTSGTCMWWSCTLFYRSMYVYGYADVQGVVVTDICEEVDPQKEKYVSESTFLTVRRTLVRMNSEMLSERSLRHSETCVCSDTSCSASSLWHTPEPMKGRGRIEKGRRKERRWKKDG